MDPIGVSETLGLDPQASDASNNIDDGLQTNPRLGEDGLRDTNVMFHAPLSELDNDMLLYHSNHMHGSELGDNNLHDNDLHEMSPHHNDIVPGEENLASTEENLSMMSAANHMGLEDADEEAFPQNEQILFEDGNPMTVEPAGGNAKCEYCGTVGSQETFYSKSKRFCKMECSKKYSALFQKKGPGTRNLTLPPSSSSSAKPQKRKINRPNVRLKKLKLEPKSSSDSTSQQTSGAADEQALTSAASVAPVAALADLETDLQQVTLSDVTKTEEASVATATTEVVEEVNEDSNAGSWIDQEFGWKEYIALTGDKPANSRLFKHAIKAPSLTESHIGLKVEVLNDNNAEKEGEGSHWVATVITTDKNMMLLRYCGCADDSMDFWFDMRSKHVHSVGWCYRLRQPLVPPPEIRSEVSNWQKFIFDELSGCRTLSTEFIDQVQNGHYNKFEIGSKVEVCDKRNLLSMCVATIVEIVGDRLRLRYDGLDEQTPDDSWSHFLSSDIHPVGWSQLVGHTLSPPTGWKHTLTEWNEFLAEDLHESKDAPQDCFVPESMGTPPSNAGFEVGMKLEALDPFNPLNLTVASVVKTLKFNYFVVGLDGQEVFFICHASNSSIFPVGWSKQHKVFLTPPKDMIGKPFDWDKYLLKSECVAAPSHLFLHLKRRIVPFEIGTKVEAVDLREPSFICPATIVAAHGNLLRIHFDGWDSTFDQWVNHESYDLFPVQWCEKNGKTLQPPGSLMPDPVLEAIRAKKTASARRTHGRIGRPPGSLNKTHTPRNPPGRPSGKGKAGGKAGAKHGKLRRTNSNTPNIPFEKQRFGNLREMRKGGEVQFAFNQKCACGPFLNQDEVRKLPDTISGYLNGPPHQNCIRKSLHEIVNAAVDPNQLLELFSREFYQSKKHKDLKLDNSICLEITGRNGKRFLRRVRGPSRSGILGKYIQRICEMLQCCPHLIVEERFAAGKCETDCHSMYVDGSVDGLGVPPVVMRTNSSTTIDDSSTMDDLPTMEDDIEDDMQSPKHHSDTDDKTAVTSTNLDSPCNPSSSSADRGIDPLNLLDQEFLSSKDPREWSVTEVMDFMTAIGCPAHAASFQNQEIDGKALFLLSFDELESLTQCKLGPITKLKDAIKSLKKMWQITTLPNATTCS